MPVWMFHPTQPPKLFDESDVKAAESQGWRRAEDVNKQKVKRGHRK